MTSVCATNTEAQQRFDRTYISSQEIMRRLKVARPSISCALKRGTLPRPILVGAQRYVWEREVAEPFIARWEEQLRALRQGATA